MKRILLAVIIAATFINPTVYAVETAYVTIIDGNNDTICATHFTGSVGMDSITQTADRCDFTYTLSFGGNFLDTINGIGWDGTNWWTLYVDGDYANKGVNDYNLGDINNILWVFSDGSYDPSGVPTSQSIGAGGIVGLINPSTGGKIDSDGDGISDVDEIKAGTDHTVNAYTGWGKAFALLEDVLEQLTNQFIK